MDGARADEVAGFMAVVEGRSFAAAGRALGRDASVVSRRVAALEARLGVRLLERSTRRVAPTEAGARFFERARAAEAILREAEDEALRFGDTPRGTLRLSLPSAFGRLWVAPLLPAFLAAHPAVAVEAHHSDRYADLVAEGFDAAIRLGELGDSRLVATRLADNRRVLCAAPSYLASRGAPADPGDLARHACLGFSGMADHPDWRFRRGDRAATVRIAGPLVSDDAQVLLAAALAGSGLMVASEWLAAPEFAAGRLVPLLPDWTLAGGGGVFLLRPSGRLTPGKTRAFADWITPRLRPAPWMRSGAG